MNKFDKLRPASEPTPKPLEVKLSPTLSIPEARVATLVPFTQRIPESTLEQFHAFYDQLKERHPKLKMWQVLNSLMIQALDDTQVQQKVVDDLF